MDNRFIIVSDFGTNKEREAHNNLWTIEVEKPSLNEMEAFSEWQQIADFDTFISFNGKHESQIVQNAIEEGAFRSVNKIRKPNTCTVELSKGGLQSDIQLVLDNLKKYKDSTDLLHVVTPFGVLEDVNLIGLDYTFKNGEGASMLNAKLTLQEVQFGSPTLEYTIETVKRAENTNTIDTGNKETKPLEA